MIKIKIIALGKLKENYLRDAAAEYIKRLSRYCDFSIDELSPHNLSESPSDREIETALEREAELIFRKVPDNYLKIALCVEGKHQDSEKFAKLIDDSKNCGTNICYIIGSSYGLCEKVKQFSDIKLSLSEMTFPHQLFRIMLLEQIYRAFKIIDGSNYHK